MRHNDAFGLVTDAEFQSWDHPAQQGLASPYLVSLQLVSTLLSLDVMRS